MPVLRRVRGFCNWRWKGRGLHRIRNPDTEELRPHNVQAAAYFAAAGTEHPLRENAQPAEMQSACLVMMVQHAFVQVAAPCTRD